MAITQSQLRLAILRWSVILIFVIVAAAYITWGQDKPPVYTPTEYQNLRLQVRQKDALLAKAGLDAAQLQFQRALAELSAEAERTKEANHWPKDTQFDMNGLGFTPPPPKPAEPTPAPAITPAKKEKPKP